MRFILAIVLVLLFCMPASLKAESDGELRGEILGEQGGKAIAKDHTEYQPEKAKEECRALFESTWRDHFDDMGFGSGPEVVQAYVNGCMKNYNKKFGK